MVVASQNVLCFLRVVVACVQTPPPLRKIISQYFLRGGGASEYRLASSPSVQLMGLGLVFCPHTSTVISNYLSFQLRKD